MKTHFNPFLNNYNLISDMLFEFSWIFPAVSAANLFSEAHANVNSLPIGELVYYA